MDFDIRALAQHHEFCDVVRLQQQIWGFQEVDLLPQRLFVVASKIGGQVLGAFQGRKMVAFCLAIPGLKAGGMVYLHSHMLGVLPAYRNTGLGRRLKLAQREFALAQRIELIEWTFDPFEIKNAFFNIERLGAIVRRYVANQYGTTSSHLHGGLPTDRLIAEWWVRSPRAETICQGLPFERPAEKHTIIIPAEMVEWKEHNRQKARQVQTEIGKQFQECFSAGLAVTGFRKTERAGAYVLGEWESE
jgi:predicted GNAT superfamily acetyltransferase